MKQGFAVLLCGLLLACNPHGGRDPGKVPAEGIFPGGFDERLRCATVAGLDVGSGADTAAHFVASWSNAPSDALITPPLVGQTVRQFVAPHWSGNVLRLRLTNRYSQQSLTLDGVHIAQESPAGRPAVVAGSTCPLTFGGQSRVTLAAGETVVSDAIHFPLRAFERVGISFHAPSVVLQMTRLLSGRETPYISVPGNFAATASGAAFVPAPLSLTNNFLVIEALEVTAAPPVRTLVTIGDSITAGSGDFYSGVLGLYNTDPNVGEDQRYPDFLARRLLQAGMPLAVVNQGIGGNRLLSAGMVPQYGVSLLERFDADALAVVGVSDILVLIGTNDLGTTDPASMPSAEAMVAGYTALIERAHAAGLNIILGTLTPAKGALTGQLPLDLQEAFGLMHGSPEAAAARTAVNEWIRTQTLSDGIVDFHACLDDPARPGYLPADYNSGDSLHPSAAGYAAMAECVDLNLFRGAP